MRVALFGGTFDPIHRGHMAIARAAADAFALDRVLIAPVGRQPLKAKQPGASFADRLAMVTLACAAESVGVASGPNAERTEAAGPARLFAASGIDAPRPDGEPNYTVDTLAALAACYPSASVFALAGADSFLNLRHWRAPDRLLELAEWIVVSRPEFPISEQFLSSLALTAMQRARVHLLSTVHEEVSATELRARLQSGDACPGLLAAGVAAYIQAHRLYRSSDPAAMP
jgi:nicotinate-nucleotide adenylyltransferase